MGNRSSHLSKRAMGDLKESTSFSKEQIEIFYKNFIKDCPDGRLSKEMFHKVYATSYPGGHTEVFCDHVFRSFDTDKSGWIDFKEFLVAMKLTSQDSNPAEKLNWTFSLYDIDGNGNIDMTEMQNIIRAIHHLLGNTSDHVRETPEARTQMIFEKVDKNKDGVISREEFVQGCINDQLLKQWLGVDAATGGGL